MCAEAVCGIAIMAKASIPGRAKTRLVPPLTFGEAAEFNTAFLQDVAANIVAAAGEVPIRGYAAFGPPEMVAFFTSLMSPIGLIEAWRSNFGDCLFVAGSPYDLFGTCRVGLAAYWHDRVGMTLPPNAPKPMFHHHSLHPLPDLVGLCSL